MKKKLMLLLLVTFTNGGSYNHAETDKLKKELSLSDSPPILVDSANSTIFTSVGQTVYLYCGVQNLGKRAVSWMRSADMTILTIGLVRYTRDPRFTAIHGKATNNWGLKIVNPSLEDSGFYECQISYHDDTEKKLKMPFELEVLESRANIVGSRDLYMNERSEVELLCRIENSPGPPAYIYWYKGDAVINYFRLDGIEVALFSEKNNVLSSLTIKSARVSDSGNYTCSPANSLPDSVILNVIKGENQAGLQEIAKSVISSAINLTGLWPLLLVCIFVLRYR